MDIQAGLICIGLVILSVAVLVFISMFDMHKKTYEEAIAEQRKMPEDSLLLGRLGRDKSKDKKQKGQGKKAKEKQNKVINSKENTKLQPGKATVKDSNKNNKKDGGKDNKKDVKKDTEKNAIKDTGKELKRENEKTAKKESKKNNQSVNKDHSLSHVNFGSPEAQILNSPNSVADQENQKKKKKRTKSEEDIKPILVNKEQPAVINNKPVTYQTPANHFTKIVPKDELRLKLSNKSEHHRNSDIENINPNKKNVKEEKPSSKANQKENNNKNNEKLVKTDVKPLKNINNKNILTNTNKQIKNEKAKVEQATKPETNELPVLKAPVHEIIPVQQKKVLNQQVNKDQKSKKNKKNELTSLQQISEKDSINIQHLIPLIRKADLSRSEVQLLTDVLLNKHADNELANHSEWIEGRQDPVVKLKKQLAEKEKALAEEQEASQAFQNKLKELRSEYNAERARFSQTCRQYEETIMAKQNDISNLHARNRHVHETHVSEKQALTQKLQQLQAQINDENIVIRKLQEENSQTHNALQKELVSQRQQMEMHMARVKEQHQEAENNLKAQIHAQLQELEQLTTSFNAEIQKNRRNEDEIRDLREQHIQNQNKIKALDSRASQLKESSNHTQELTRQIEDLQRTNKELEKRLSGALKLEEEFQFEKVRLQNDIHAYKTNLSELQNEFDKIMKEKEKLAGQVLSKIETEKELIRLKDENKNLTAQVATFTKIEKEAQQLREENENLAAQMTAFTERPAADGRENGDSIYNEDQKKNINIDFINHENESRTKDAMTEKLETQLHQDKILIESLNEELSNCKTEIAQLNSEIIKFKTQVPRLHEELEELRNKNNDIHRRNWKAMEALAETEKSLENEQKKTEKLSNERLLLIQHQELSKDIMHRIFPDIKVDEEAYEKWLLKFEESAKQYLSDLTSSQKENTEASNLINELEIKNSQLQALVTHYKTIIGDTEGMLSNLQSHIEKEEIRWNQKLEKKDLEITALKKDYDALSERINLQNQTKMNELEDEISNARSEIESARKTICELEKVIENDKEEIKKLSKENISLNSKLRAETEKMNENNKEVIKLKSAVEEQNKMRMKLEEELKVLESRTRQIDSSATEVSAENEKPKPRKAKWPFTGWVIKGLRLKRRTNRRHRRQ